MDEKLIDNLMPTNKHEFPLFFKKTKRAKKLTNFEIRHSPQIEQLKFFRAKITCLKSLNYRRTLQGNPT